MVTPPRPSVSTLLRNSARASAPLSTNSVNFAPREDRLDAERAGAGEEIEHARILDRIVIGVHEDVEHGLAQAIRRGADVARGR